MAEVERADTLDSRSGRLAEAEYFGIEAENLSSGSFYAAGA